MPIYKIEYFQIYYTNTKNIMYTMPGGMATYLIGICKAAHAAHDAQHVVVCRIDADLRGQVVADRVVGHREEERGVINAGQVARA